MEGGRGSGIPGEKGPGDVREAGEEGAGSGRKRGKLPNIAQYFAILKNAKRREPTNTEQEPGLKGTGSGWFKPPVPPLSYGYTSITHGDSPCWWTLWP